MEKPKEPPSPPAMPPKDQDIGESAETAAKPVPTPDPTRYGDWERSGRCIDF